MTRGQTPPNNQKFASVCVCVRALKFNLENPVDERRPAIRGENRARGFWSNRRWETIANIPKENILSSDVVTHPAVRGQVGARNMAVSKNFVKVGVTPT